MAAAADPDEVLRSTDGKANFQRLARLLISGGTSLLREIFDAIHPPSNLPTILSNPVTEKQLKAARLTKPQWDSLYPSTGVYGKSADFDVTLLFRLLRTICNLSPPSTGWDALPASKDHSLTADLARIKYYRNSVYGHVNQKMEIPDDQFLTLWQEISEALVRIAGQISPTKEKEWQRVINNYLKSPLTPEDERNIYVKKIINQLETTVREEHQDTRNKLNNTTQVLREEHQDTRQELNNATQVLREEHQDTRQELNNTTQVLREEHQDTRHELNKATQVLREATRQELNNATQVLREEHKDTRKELDNTTQVLREEYQDTRQELNNTTQVLREDAQDTRKELKNTTQVLREEHQDTRQKLNNKTQVLREEHQDTRKELNNTTQVLREEAEDTKKELNTATQVLREEHQDTRKELNNATQVLREEAEDTRNEVNTATQVLREEVQDIKDQLGEVLQSIQEWQNSSAVNSQSIGAHIRVHIDCEAITGPEGRATGMVITPQESQIVKQERIVVTVTSNQPQAVVQGATAVSKVSNHQQAPCLTGGNVGTEVIPSAQEVLNFIAINTFNSVDPSKKEELNYFLEYLKEVRKVLVIDTQTGSLIITVECGTRQILEELWEDYRIGHLNEMAEKFVLKKFGLIPVKLTTTIVEEEYIDGRLYFLKRSATDSSALAKQVEQLRRPCQELYGALLRWIPIRTRAMKQLQELATKLDEHHRNVTKATITGASMGTVGGILAIAGLIAAPFTFGTGLIVSLVGAGIGGAGGLVMSGSKVVESVMEKSGLKEVQAAIDEDRKECIIVQEQLDSLENSIYSLTDDAVLVLRKLEGSGFEFLRERIGFELSGSSTKERGEFGAKFFRAGTSFAAAASAGAMAGNVALHFVIGVAVLPLDIVQIVKSSLELHRGSTSAAVEDIRRILNELECPDKEEIQGFVASFIVEKSTEAYKERQIKKDYQHKGHLQQKKKKEEKKRKETKMVLR